MSIELKVPEVGESVREVQIGRDLLEGFDHQHLIAYSHCHAFCPTAGDVGQRQGVNVVTVRLRAAAVLDQVDFEEPWRRSGSG